MNACPLCGGNRIADFYEDRNRKYCRCGECFLIFVPPAFFLPPDKEKARYDAHRNFLEDGEYRSFLSRLVEPLSARLGAYAFEGLDFGCGPGPVLSFLLQEKGYRVTLYDPYYACNPPALERVYDFVTCTEVMEHFYVPRREWDLLVGLLKPGGWLGVMTGMAEDVKGFSNWYYKNDLTHVSFFSRETFLYLARREGMSAEFVGKDVVLLRKVCVD